MKTINKLARPVYLNMFAFAFTVTAIASIIHRVTGVLLALGLIPLIIIWHTSLISEANFALVSEWMQWMWLKVFVWAYLSCLFYHALAGIKHLAMDLGWGETQSTASILSWSIMLIAVLFAGGLFYLLLFI